MGGEGQEDAGAVRAKGGQEGGCQGDRAARGVAAEKGLHAGEGKERVEILQTVAVEHGGNIRKDVYFEQQHVQTQDQVIQSQEDQGLLQQVHDREQEVHHRR